MNEKVIKELEELLRSKWKLRHDRNPLLRKMVRDKISMLVGLLRIKDIKDL